MMLKIINDIAKDVAIKTQERLKNEGGELQTIITEELLKEVQKKSHNANLQVKQSDHTQLFNNIIAPGEGIDNNEIYNEDTGETIRDLDYEERCICQK
jgi:hypothetical protein